MKKNPDHLSETKRKEITRIVSTIRKSCNDVEMIILFGSYARGDYKVKEDLTPYRKSGHVSDYDILLVTRYKDTIKNGVLEDELSRKCSQLKLSAHARIIAHDIQDLNIRLAEGQYFFSDIKKEGCVLFDTGNFLLAYERALTPTERQRVAQDHFDHWFEFAKNFFRQYRHALDDNDLKTGAFDLHQSVESSFKTILLVFTNYSPNEHWLAALSKLVVDQAPSFSGIFPLDTQKDEARFKLLDYAYIGARYDPGYRISKDDLQLLAASVTKLLKHTETVCRQKIQSLVP